MSGYHNYLRAEWEMFARKPARGRILLEAVREMRVERVLDVGCGAGQELLPFVRERGAAGVGVDVSAEVGVLGRELFGAHAPGARVAFARAAAEALPFVAGAFDVVICRLALPYTYNAHALAEMARVLGPDGALLVQIHHALYYLRDAGRSLASLNVRSVIHDVRVLVTGAVYGVTGRQPRTRLLGTETFQTKSMLQRELVCVGLEIRREMPGSNPATPFYFITKKAQ